LLALIVPSHGERGLHVVQNGAEQILLHEAFHEQWDLNVPHHQNQTLWNPSIPV
jgi:hypothetical protein